MLQLGKPHVPLLSRVPVSGASASHTTVATSRFMEHPSQRDFEPGSTGWKYSTLHPILTTSFSEEMDIEDEAYPSSTAAAPSQAPASTAYSHQLTEMAVHAGDKLAASPPISAAATPTAATSSPYLSTAMPFEENNNMVPTPTSPAAAVPSSKAPGSPTPSLAEAVRDLVSFAYNAGNEREDGQLLLTKDSDSVDDRHRILKAGITLVSKRLGFSTSQNIQLHTVERELGDDKMAKFFNTSYSSLCTAYREDNHAEMRSLLRVMVMSRG